MKPRDICFAAATVKPVASATALFLGPGPWAVNDAGIYAIEPALTSLWCAVCGALCYCSWSVRPGRPDPDSEPRGYLGRRLGWLWMLSACGWANRTIRDAGWSSPDPEWLLPIAIARLLWKYDDRRPLIMLIDSPAPELRRAGFWAAAAICTAPLVLMPITPDMSIYVAGIIYGTNCAGSFASAQLARIKPCPSS